MRRPTAGRGTDSAGLARASLRHGGTDATRTAGEAPAGTGTSGAEPGRYINCGQDAHATRKEPGRYINCGQDAHATQKETGGYTSSNILR